MNKDWLRKNWIVYILLCKDATFYTGISNDINRRLLEHEKGSGAKYTRGRGPFKIVYEAFFNTASEASKEEYRIKKLSKAQKITLTKNYLGFNK